MISRDEADRIQSILDYYKIMRDRKYTIPMRIILASTIEPLLPKRKFLNVDVSAILGMCMIIHHGKESVGQDIIFPVVNGYESNERNYSNDEYIKSYCIRVPDEIVKDALAIRMGRVAQGLVSRSLNEKE